MYLSLSTIAAVAALFPSIEAAPLGAGDDLIQASPVASITTALDATNTPFPDVATPRTRTSDLACLKTGGSRNCAKSELPKGAWEALHPGNPGIKARSGIPAEQEEEDDEATDVEDQDEDAASSRIPSPTQSSMATGAGMPHGPGNSGSPKSNPEGKGEMSALPWSGNPSKTTAMGAGQARETGRSQKETGGWTDEQKKEFFRKLQEKKGFGSGGKGNFTFGGEGQSANAGLGLGGGSGPHVGGDDSRQKGKGPQDGNEEQDGDDQDNDPSIPPVPLPSPQATKSSSDPSQAGTGGGSGTPAAPAMTPPPSMGSTDDTDKDKTTLFVTVSKSRAASAAAQSSMGAGMR